MNSKEIVPYSETHINVIYNLLFCDDLNLLKQQMKEPYIYPYDILFGENSSVAELQRILDEANFESRIKMLAYTRQLMNGCKPKKKELLAVIVEVGLDKGLDVLASFADGTARYINYTGKMIVWENTDDQKANDIKKQLFDNSIGIVNQIGPWEEPRKPNPKKGNVRISFIVSGELYFGEGPMKVMFSDPVAGPVLANATELMQYLIQNS